MKPFTPESLAERWDCSAANIRLLCKQGKIEHFRIGTKYRIRADVVERIECGNPDSQGTGGDSPSSSTNTAQPNERPWVPRTRRKPSGGSGTGSANQAA